jgi:phosphoribosyl 1,2-cyclic phosphodiesterase
VRLPDGQILIIDGGTGARNLGLALQDEFGKQSLSLHYFLTHFHWDHIQGLPFFGPLYSPANEVVFHATQTPEILRETLEGQMSNPYFPVGFELLGARRKFVTVDRAGMKLGDVAIQAVPLNHPQGASGFRFESAGGVLVHASDHEHGNAAIDQALRESAEGADILIYDAQYTPEEYETHRGWGHSTWLEATRVARDAGVKKLVLFHHDPSHDDVTMERILEQARQHFEATELAVEGKSYSI